MISLELWKVDMALPPDRVSVTVVIGQHRKRLTPCRNQIVSPKILAALIGKLHILEGSDKVASKQSEREQQETGSVTGLTLGVIDTTGHSSSGCFASTS